VRRAHPAAEHVERHPRPRHVGRDRLAPHLPGGNRGAHAQGEHRRGDEVAHRDDGTGVDGLHELLVLVHLPADRGQPGHRVGLTDGQVDEDGRDLVVQLPALVGLAHRDGHHRPHDQPLAQRTAPLEQVAEAAGDGSEHDVVDGAAERRPDPPEVLELGVGPGPAPVRADRPVERAGGRRRQLAGHGGHVGRQ
jgi:hypothetical protein